MCFEDGKVSAVTYEFGERVPEGGGSYRKGSVTPCPVLGPMGDGQEVGIRGAELTGWSLVVEQVGEVRGGLIIEGFVREEKDFVLYPLWDRKPVEVLKNRGDVISGAGVGEQASSRVLDVLEFVQDFG